MSAPAKPLKLYNGMLFLGSKQKHCNVAAHSRADAARVIAEALGYMPYGIAGTLKTYWSDCWGNSMDGIRPRRGMWVENNRDSKPQFMRPITRVDP